MKDDRVRVWLEQCQVFLQMRYSFDTGLGTFDTLDGNHLAPRVKSFNSEPPSGVWPNATSERPEPPRRNVPPSVAPVDLANRESSASTVYVGNIHRDASELEILELFNSVGGVYGNREPNIVVAVNFVYQDGSFRGQAHLLCSTIALAEFAVRHMHDRKLRRRPLGCASRITATIQGTLFGAGTSWAT